MGNFTKFLSERIVGANLLLSSSLNLVHFFFPSFEKKKNKIPRKKIQKYDFSDISKKRIHKVGMNTDKHQKKVELRCLPFFLFFFRFYHIFFTTRKKSFSQFKKTIEFKFFISFLKKLEKKLNLKNKSNLLTGEESLTYLNRISKFHFRQSIDKIQKKKQDEKFGLFREKINHNKIFSGVVEKEKNKSFIGRISNQRLLKLKTLYQILKKKKINFSEKDLFNNIPVFNDSFSKQNQSNVLPKFTNFSIRKNIRKKEITLLKRWSKPKYILRMLDHTNNIVKKKIPEIQSFNTFFFFWISSEINTIHILSLLLAFFLEKLDMSNGNGENFYFFSSKVYGATINLIPPQEYSEQLGKFFHKTNFKKVEKNIRLFLKKSRTSFLNWKIFILFLRTKATGRIFKKKQVVLIQKLRYLIEKLRSVQILKNKIKSKLNKGLKMYKKTSVETGLVVLKFLALQRLFLYQKLLVKELYLKKTKVNESKVFNLRPEYLKTKSLKTIKRKVEKFKKKYYCNNFNEDNGVIKALKKKLNCSVINTLQKEVVLTNCGHLFSSKCIQNLNFSRNRSCPICGRKFSKGSIRSIFFC